MLQYRAVFFDAVGTLIHPEPSAATIYLDVGRRFGTRRSHEEIAARFVAALQAQEEIDRAQGWRTSEERERRRWRDIVAYVLDDVTDPASCFAALYEHFAQRGAWRCADNLEPLLARLHRSGLILGFAGLDKFFSKDEKNL